MVCILPENLKLALPAERGTVFTVIFYFLSQFTAQNMNLFWKRDINTHLQTDLLHVFKRINRDWRDGPGSGSA